MKLIAVMDGTNLVHVYMEHPKRLERLFMEWRDWYKATYFPAFLRKERCKYVSFGTFLVQAEEAHFATEDEVMVWWRNP